MAVAEQNRDCGNEKHGKTPDAKIPDRVGGEHTCSRAFHTWQRLPGTKGSGIFNAWPPVYLIRLHHYFCYQGNTQLNGVFFYSGSFFRWLSWRVSARESASFISAAAA